MKIRELVAAAKHVSDALHTHRNAFLSLAPLLGGLPRIADTLREHGEAALADEIEAIAKEADVPLLLLILPTSFERAFARIKRITQIEHEEAPFESQIRVHANGEQLCAFRLADALEASDDVFDLPLDRDTARTILLSPSYAKPVAKGS